jgi:hypothetical protein
VIDGNAITQATVGLLNRSQNGTFQSFCEENEINHEDLQTYAEMAADEEFQTLEMFGMARDVGRLQKLGLDAQQEAEVKEALVDTFVVALSTGVVLGRGK